METNKTSGEWRQPVQVKKKKAFGGFAVKKQVGLLAAQMYLCLDGDL